MKPAALVLASAVAIGATLPAPQAAAQSIPCGTQYRVVAGDSLSAIARRAYGETSAFTTIYNANVSVIGSNPGIIEIDMVLNIPCTGEAAPAQPEVAVIRPTPTTEALPAPPLGQIRLVTGDDWAPFTNESHPTGGLAVEVTNVALSVADAKPQFKIDFINDWGAHLRPLITDHAYDFSLVWFRPNCDVVEKLGEGSKFRCNNLDWSDAIFQQIIGYYTLAGTPPPATYRDLFGKTICRPSGYSTFMMEEVDLVEPNITLQNPTMTTDCFEGLLTGQYDAVILASDVADGAITKLGARNQVAFHDHLSQVATMHAVIAKTHPRGPELLAILNNGLQKLKKSGEWFRIISRHLAEHRSKTRS